MSSGFSLGAHRWLGGLGLLMFEVESQIFTNCRSLAELHRLFGLTSIPRGL